LCQALLRRIGTQHMASQEEHGNRTLRHIFGSPQRAGRSWADLVDSSQESPPPPPAPVLERSYDEQAVGIESGQNDLSARMQAVMEMGKGPIDFGLLKEDFMEATSTSSNYPATSTFEGREMPIVPDFATSSQSFNPVSLTARPRKRFDPIRFLQRRSIDKNSEQITILNRTTQSRPQNSRKTGREKQGAVPLSQADWERRFQKRLRAIAGVKDSLEYKNYIAQRPISERRKEDPVTPNAEDRKVPKRSWEFAISEWRKELKSWCVEKENDVEMAI